MNVLGISPYYHDSATALVHDGEIVAATQEERFTRKKGDHRFPSQSLESVIKAGGSSLAGRGHHVVDGGASAVIGSGEQRSVEKT
jgi:carbamoyltransferase